MWGLFCLVLEVFLFCHFFGCKVTWPCLQIVATDKVAKGGKPVDTTPDAMHFAVCITYPIYLDLYRYVCSFLGLLPLMSQDGSVPCHSSSFETTSPQCVLTCSLRGTRGGRCEWRILHGCERAAAQHTNRGGPWPQRHLH